MSAHDCKTYNPSCFRCDLSRAEVEDDFTDAAREEARSYHAFVREGGWNWSVEGHGAHMARWARGHLAQQDPSAAEVKAAFESWEAHYLSPDGTCRACGARSADPDGHAFHAALTAARDTRRDEEKRNG